MRLGTILGEMIFLSASSLDVAIVPVFPVKRAVEVSGDLKTRADQDCYHCTRISSLSLLAEIVSIS